MRVLYPLLFLLLSSVLAAQSDFEHTLNTEALPWTNRAFDDAPGQFQFAVVSDRTGGHRAGIFGDAMAKLNLLHPEFVMSVGDLVEGYTKDTAIISAQWAEFDSILAKLNMRFFALPGNHDISNAVMRKHWLDKYGASYYHFRYKDVLFMAFDSNDGDGVAFSREQLDYFQRVLAENEDARWTLLFMHHPIWNYREFNGFNEIEEALQGRPYTVFAGHTHRYFKSKRQGRNYYVLSTTGGGSALRSPRLGEFDHVTWVTMTEAGPELVHLQLSGIIEDDVLTEQTAPMARALHNATQIEPLVLQTSDTEALVILRIANTIQGKSSYESSGLFSKGQQSGQPAQGEALHFEGRFYHNHHLLPGQAGFTLTVPADSAVQVAIPIAIKAGARLDEADPLELDWALSFESDPFDPAFELSGILEIEPDYQPTGLGFTPMDVFLEEHTIELTAPYEDLLIRYTLDGSEPTAAAALYSGPFEISATTTVKARYFDAAGKARSAVAEQRYRKVSPQAPVKISKRALSAGLRYAYYEGDFSAELPNFATLEPLRTGIARYSHPDSLERRMDHFALAFEGYIDIPKTGIYTFYTRSDDGSQLFLHDKLVVDNNGSHSARARRGHIALQAGLHPIRVTYFEDFLGETLEIGYEAEGLPRRRVPFAELYHEKQ
mgnify:CR=1 FL=1